MTGSVTSRNRMRILAVIIAALMIFSAVPAAAAADTPSPKATIMFASDYQYENGASPAQPNVNLTGIVSQIVSHGKDVERLIYCGDYTNTSGLYNYNSPAGTSIGEIKSIVSSAFGPDTGTLFLQGNHDLWDADLMGPTGGYEYESYIVYLINTESSNPWNQGSTGAKSIVQNTASNLETYLNGLISNGETRPVFICTHVPLHMSGRTSSLYTSGDNMYSSYLFNVINAAAEDLDIVFLYGHNHSHGWDSYLGGSCVYIPRGGTIYIPVCEGVTTRYTDRYTAETLNFTYMNAGFTGYNSGTTADNTLTCSVFEIYDDHMEVGRYDANGVHDLCSVGHYNTTSDGGRYNDSNGFPNGNGPIPCSAAVIPSTQTVDLINVSDAAVLRLEGAAADADITDTAVVTAVLENEPEAENVTYSWTSSDSSVARIIGSGSTVNVEYNRGGTATVTCSAAYTAAGTAKTVRKAYTVSVRAEVKEPGTEYSLVTDVSALSGDGFLIIYSDGDIVEPSIFTNGGRTGFVCERSIPDAGSSTVTGDYSAYEWKFTSGSYGGTVFRLIQAAGISGSNYVRFDTANNFPASFTSSSDASRFMISFKGNLATFAYANTDTVSYDYRMQKNTGKNVVYGYGSNAGTTDFYIYEKTAVNDSEVTAEIVLTDGQAPSGEYEAGTSEVFRPSVTNIGAVISYAWTSSDPGVISFSDSSVAQPTVSFNGSGTAEVTLTVAYDENGNTLTVSASAEITVTSVVISYPGCSLESGVLRITPECDMSEWTSLSDRYWNEEASSITGVIIESGVTLLGDHAFEGCDRLAVISVPASVESIGLNAFGDCPEIVGVPGSAAKAYAVSSGKSFILLGDVNRDGRINQKDNMLIEKYLIPSDNSKHEDLTAAQLAAADTDHDGRITRNDTTCISRSLLPKWHVMYQPLH